MTSKTVGAAIPLHLSVLASVPAPSLEEHHDAAPAGRGCRSSNRSRSAGAGQRRFAVGLAVAVVLLPGCVAPIGTERVTTRQVYAQLEANALSRGKPSADTVALLHRHDLDPLANRQPDEVVRRLHGMALATGERDLLFALAEMSYLAGNRIARSVKPWEQRDERDYYLGAALYAWLFLFGQDGPAPPTAYDRRFRTACDLYNYGLGLGLAVPGTTNGAVQLQSVRRNLPVGSIQIELGEPPPSLRLEEYVEVLRADQFRVRGLTVRDRESGVGTPLLFVGPLHPTLRVRCCTPVTLLLRGPVSLAALEGGQAVGRLELCASTGGTLVGIGGNPVPLEVDLTTFRAYTLNQSMIWKVGVLQFLAPPERGRSELILIQPYDPSRIPVVLVHGTFASPAAWAEMANTLTADPVLRRRYQVWSFFYSSSNPLLYSMRELRTALTAEVQRRDPEGTNAALRQMVVVGHSQGGLLAKSVAVDTGDLLWSEYSTNRFEDLNLDESLRAELEGLLFLKPLPFVKRVVFVATPHRGSYLSSRFVRRLARGLVSLPKSLVYRGAEMLRLIEGSDLDKMIRGHMPTSLDGMSPKNPCLLALADIPVDPTITAHSIIPVLGNGDYREGRDGVVAYQSAHVDYAESELIVRGGHSCLDQAATIQEVRRLLHDHLEREK